MPRERSEQTRSYPVGISGTSDTGRGHVCPCGRAHPRQQGRARKREYVDSSTGEIVSQTTGWQREERYSKSREELAASVYEAKVQGKAVQEDGGDWVVRYSGDCIEPIPFKRASLKGWLQVTYLVRCRRCKPCLRARQFYWSRTAIAWTKATADQGRRTWFGTLTFSPEAQREALQQAFEAWAASTGGSSADWWDEPLCDERFRLVRDIMVGWVQRYWKRLRKGVKRCERCYPRKPRKKGEWDHPGQRFKYFLVFERHKSGLPHIHWLLHEQERPILLKQLACEWPYGFTKVVLVKGADMAKAGFYVSKYLGKAVQARQIASVGYAKNCPSLGK